jgi:hypothetical protein
MCQFFVFLDFVPVFLVMIQVLETAKSHFKISVVIIIIITITITIIIIVIIICYFVIVVSRSPLFDQLTDIHRLKKFAVIMQP